MHLLKRISSQLDAKEFYFRIDKKFHSMKKKHSQAITAWYMILKENDSAARTLSEKSMRAYTQNDFGEFNDKQKTHYSNICVCVCVCQRVHSVTHMTCCRRFSFSLNFYFKIDGKRLHAP